MELRKARAKRRRIKNILKINASAERRREYPCLSAKRIRRIRDAEIPVAPEKLASARPLWAPD